MDSRRRTSTLSCRSDGTANSAEYHFFICTEDDHE
jgi:hypothetical protein